MAPFFLLRSIYAGLAVLSWLPLFFGELSLHSAFAPRDWHFHEMLYGYLPAVITGFLFTTIPNWTGQLPIQGKPLLALVLAWLAGRFVVTISADVGWLPAAAIDVGFLALVVVGLGFRPGWPAHRNCAWPGRTAESGAARPLGGRPNAGRSPGFVPHVGYFFVPLGFLAAAAFGLLPISYPGVQKGLILRGFLEAVLIWRRGRDSNPR